MKTSLSLVLPVRNAQDFLARQVVKLLEVLPEMSPDFELLLVDDGSTDNTEEVATEIAREYPQVRLVRHGEPRGAQAAIEAGLRAAVGEVVLVHPQGNAVSQNDLLRAWRGREPMAPQVPAASAHPRPISEGLLDRLRQWGQNSSRRASSASKPAAAAPATVAIVRRRENNIGQLAESRKVVKLAVRGAHAASLNTSEKSEETGSVWSQMETFARGE